MERCRGLRRVNFVSASKTQLISGETTLYNIVNGEKKALKPVTWAPMGTRKRLKQGKKRTQVVTQALLEPAKILLREAMREVRTSGHRVMAVKQVHDAIYKAKEAVKAANIRSKRPLNVTNDAATYRGVTKLTKTSLEARDAVTRALKITVANKRLHWSQKTCFSCCHFPLFISLLLYAL